MRENTEKNEFAASEEVLKCCTLQGEEVDTSFDMEWEHRHFCCDALNWRGPRACTPWGPPTPPHMA